MSSKFDGLQSEINECFYAIVGIINEIIEHRTESFSNMVDVSEDIQKGAENFLLHTDKIVENISDNINKKIESLDMDHMKQEIDDATATFLSITEELELLSYNTICRTMALGDKGATITHISKEIKKYSTTVKELLDVISKNFNELFKRFHSISDNLMENKFNPEDESLDIEVIDEYIITSDASVLIENSQFHDIFTQELEILRNAISTKEYANAYEAGEIFGKYEKAMTKLDFVKYAIQDKLEGIKDVMGDFIYTFNTDLQNIASQTNILRSEIKRVSEVSEGVCSTMSSMKNSVESTKAILDKTSGSVDMLAKHSKTFKNLVVITAVEVARINDDSLKSVVVSMSETEEELKGLIDKLYNNMDMWSALRNNFMETFNLADNEMLFLCKTEAEAERQSVMKRTLHLDCELDSFKNIFMADKYISFFDQNSGRLGELFEIYNESVQEEFVAFNESLSDEILSDEEFTRGRNDADIKDILAQEEEQSTIEFF